MATIKANKCLPFIKVCTEYCPDRPTVSGSTTQVSYWSDFESPICLNNSPSFVQLNSFVVYTGQDYKLYKYDGDYIYPFAIDDDKVANTSWGLKNWEKNLIKCEGAHDTTKDLPVASDDSVSATFTIYYADFTDANGTVKDPVADYGVEVGDYLWVEGHVYKITAIDTSAKTITVTFLEDEGYYYEEGSRGFEKAGFTFCIAEPTLIDGSSGEYEPSGLEDGKLYEYVLTFTTKFGFESNPTPAKSIYAYDTSAIKISVNKLPYPVSYISSINIYRSYGDKPNVWYYVDSIDVLNSFYNDVSLYHWEDYQYYDVEADLSDLEDWETEGTVSDGGTTVTTNCIIYSNPDVSERGLTFVGDITNVETASPFVTTFLQSSNRATTSSFWTEFKVGNVQGMVDAETDPTKSKGLSFIITNRNLYDNYTDLLDGDYSTDGYRIPKKCYGLTITPYTGGTMTNPYIMLSLWKYDSEADVPVTILGSKQIFRNSDYTTYDKQGQDLNQDTIDLFYIGDTFRVFRDNNTGEISVYRKHDETYGYSLEFSVMDDTWTDFYDVGFMHNLILRNYYDTASSSEESNDIDSPQVIYFKRYKSDDYYYIDFTPDELLGARIGEYKIVPDKVEGLAVAGNRLFAFYKNNLYVSSPLDFESFTRDVLFSRSIIAIASLELFGILAVFCEDGVYAYEYNRDVATKIADGITTFTKNSVCTYNNMVYFLCNRGLYMFNGGKVQPVPNNERIDALFQKRNGFTPSRGTLNSYFQKATLNYNYDNDSLLGIVGYTGIVYYLPLQAFSIYDFKEIGEDSPNLFENHSISTQFLSFMDNSINKAIQMLCCYAPTEYETHNAGDSWVAVQKELSTVNDWYLEGLAVGQVDDIIRPRELFISVEKTNEDDIIAIKIEGNYDLSNDNEEEGLLTFGYKFNGTTGVEELITKLSDEQFVDLYDKDVSIYKFKVLRDSEVATYIPPEVNGVSIPQYPLTKIRRISLRLQLLARRKRQWKQ